VADDQDILTVKELCELLRLHPATLYKLVKQGKIPSFRIGTKLRFRKDVIMRWIAQRSMEAQQVRKVIDTGVDGGARHRRRAALRRPKR
jgi:excisionase family DNA binding protein